MYATIRQAKDAAEQVAGQVTGNETGNDTGNDTGNVTKQSLSSHQVGTKLGLSRD